MDNAALARYLSEIADLLEIRGDNPFKIRAYRNASEVVIAETRRVTELDEAALRELEASFGGRLVAPQDPSYDEDRKVWNGSIDRRPALIARCSGVADVIAAVATILVRRVPRAAPAALPAVVPAVETSPPRTRKGRGR